MTSSDTPRRRQADRTRWSRTVQFCRSHAQAILSVTMVILATGLGSLALYVWGKEAERDRIARTLCERTRDFGPLNATEHEILGVYSEAQLEEFRRTIPVSCA